MPSDRLRFFAERFQSIGNGEDIEETHDVECYDTLTEDENAAFIIAMETAIFHPNQKKEANP